MMPFKAMRLKSAGGGGTDPNFASVVSLCHCDGAHDSTVLTDQVPARTWTRRNLPLIKTDQYVFGGASALFNGGGSEDSWDTPDHTDWEFGSGDFTLEGRVRFASVGGGEAVLSKTNVGGVGPFLVYRNSTSLLFYASSNGSTWDIANGLVIGTVAIDTWYGWAVDRVGTNIYTYLDGTYANTASSSAALYDNTEVVRLGSYNGVSTSFGGYQDEFRATNGIGRYGGSNYTLAASPFPDS